MREINSRSRHFEDSLNDPRVRALYEAGAKVQTSWRPKALTTAEG